MSNLLIGIFLKGNFLRFFSSFTSSEACPRWYPLGSTWPQKCSAAPNRIYHFGTPENHFTSLSIIYLVVDLPRSKVPSSFPGSELDLRRFFWEVIGEVALNLTVPAEITRYTSRSCDNWAQIKRDIIPLWNCSLSEKECSGYLGFAKIHANTRYRMRQISKHVI